MKQFIIFAAAILICGTAHAGKSASQLDSSMNNLRHLWNTFPSISASELSIVDSGQAVSATCSQGTEYGSFITLTITWKDANGTAVAYAMKTQVFFSVSTSVPFDLVDSNEDPASVSDVTGLSEIAGVASVVDMLEVWTSTAGIWSAKLNSLDAALEDWYVWAYIPATGKFVGCGFLMDND